MNLVLLEPGDFIEANRVRLKGRTRKHILEIHKAQPGDELRVGVVNGKIGTGRIERISVDAVELTVRLETEPPPPLPLRLVLALPRPKVLNRTIVAATSMGIREIDLIHAWRVEKAYWSSPRLSDENLRLQAILGLEQAGDTVLPSIRQHKLFAAFVRKELPSMVSGKFALLAHPGVSTEPPRHVDGPAILAIGPEGGFIDREVESFRAAGFQVVSFGPRILRVETALAFLIGRIF